MKNIFEYLQESLLKQNNELINESFKANIFHKIQAQLASYNEKEKQEDKEAKERGWTWHSPTYKTFKNIMSGCSIAWDKITDTDVKECSKTNKADLSLAKRIVAQRSNHVDGLIFLYNEDGDFFDCVIVSLGGWTYYNSFRSSWGYRDNKIRPSDVEGILTNKFYVIEINDELKTYKKQTDRRNAQWGSFTPGDEQYYKQVAEQNVTRYKKLLAKYKAEREANDGISENINEYTQKVLKFAEKISKEPLRYAKLEYKIGMLMELIKGERKYVRGYGRNNGYYSGKDGLLKLYTNYLEAKLSMGSGNSYDSDVKTFNSLKKSITDICTNIDTSIASIEAEIAKNES